MNRNRFPELHRRAFLRRSALLAGAGVAAPWALNLAAIADAAAADTSGGYKALVCVFLYGGNDYGNTLLPVDAARHANYLQLRGGLGLELAALDSSRLLPRLSLPDGQQLAMSPQLAPLKPLFDAGQMGWLTNVGPLIQPTTKAQYRARSVPLPPKLFSHNDQQSVWQSSAPEGATRGWGGALGDLMLGGNGNATFSCISVTGNAVFLAGQQAVQYQVSQNGAVPINAVVQPFAGSRQVSDALRTLITQPRSHLFEAELNRVSARSIDAEVQVKGALAGALPFNTVFDNGSALARQLRMVARLIAGRSALQANRQVFLVSLGGFDNHDNLGDQHPALLTQLGNSLASFQAALTELGVADRVTTFTASDFGRTLTSNGNGSDHGWGSHHLLMGGALQGRRFWGTVPELGNDGPDDVGQGRLLPTTSVDQMAATLARWIGVADSELPLVLPNIGNFSQRDLGFFSV
jgi:uncharacterized protein (DUF1501 family)